MKEETKRKISEKAKLRYALGHYINCKIYDIPSKEDLVYLYIERGFSLNKVSKMMNVNINTCKKWLKDYGITIRSLEEYNQTIQKTKKVKKKKEIPSPDCLIYLNHDEGLTFERIALLFNLSKATIYNLFKRYKIIAINNQIKKPPTVTPEKRKILAEKNRKYTVDDYKGISELLDPENYKNTSSILTFKCPCGNIFKTNFWNATFAKTKRNNVCKLCSDKITQKEYKARAQEFRELSNKNRKVYNRSKAEIDLYEWVKQYAPDAEHSFFLGGYSYDICIPSKKLLIEYQGLYWHSETFYYTGQNHNNKTLQQIKYMHKHKKDAAVLNGYRLFQVWEDDWARRETVIKEFILTILGIGKEKVFARKCKVVGVPRLRTDGFLDRFHIQGSMTRYSCSIGLAYGNDLIAVMAFAQEPDGTINLARYAVDSRYQIIGGFAKLLAWFNKKYPRKQIITFADLSYVNENDNVYLRNGFVPIKEIAPDYKYIVGEERHHKFSFRRKNLESMFGKNFKPELSEYQNCVNNGVYRAWDTGKIKYIFNK